MQARIIRKEYLPPFISSSRWILAQAYHYVRFRWWSRLDLEGLSEELSQKYDVKSLDLPSYELELTYRKDERDEYLVKSDTLTVFLGPFRAVMSQKKSAPFTPSDVELRSRIIELYPHDRPILLPWNFGSEPRFETIEKKE
jgi:hypothetical protein